MIRYGGGKNLFPFCRLPLYLNDGVFCHAEAMGSQERPARVRAGMKQWGREESGGRSVSCTGAGVEGRPWQVTHCRVGDGPDGLGLEERRREMVKICS